MKGDYHRYLAEFKIGAERNEIVENTFSAYKSAQVRVFYFFFFLDPGVIMGKNYSMDQWNLHFIVRACCLLGINS